MKRTLIIILIIGFIACSIVLYFLSKDSEDTRTNNVSCVLDGNGSLTKVDPSIC